MIYNHDKEPHWEDKMTGKTLRPTRRAFLAGAGALTGTAALGFRPRRARAAKSLKVGTYGGYFQDSFDKHIYPDFTKETGIEVESIGEPTGEAWLVQLETAAKAGSAPADVSMMAQTTPSMDLRAISRAHHVPESCDPSELQREAMSVRSAWPCNGPAARRWERIRN